MGLIKERWGEDTAKDLMFVYEVIQPQNNAMLHPTPTAYRQVVMTDDQGRPRAINRIGPDSRWIDSLGHGILGFYFACRVLAEEFDLDKDPAAEAFNQASSYVKRIPNEELEGLGTDALCPCESGRAVAQCHGA